MEAVSCITGRRSIRNFDTEKEIPKELLESIISTASFAPSWKNSQVTRYIAVTGDTKAKLAECTNIWAKNGDIIRNAPMVVALTVVKNRSGYERDGSFSTPHEDGWQYFDCGIAAQSFCLAAYEKGLGTVVLGLYDDNAADVLGVPEDQLLVALIPVGFPAEEPVAPKRKTVEDLLSYRS